MRLFTLLGQGLVAYLTLWAAVTQGQQIGGARFSSKNRGDLDTSKAGKGNNELPHFWQPLPMLAEITIVADENYSLQQFISGQVTLSKAVDQYRKLKGDVSVLARYCQKALVLRPKNKRVFDQILSYMNDVAGYLEPRQLTKHPDLSNLADRLAESLVHQVLNLENIADEQDKIIGAWATFLLRVKMPKDAFKTLTVVEKKYPQLQACLYWNTFVYAGRIIGLIEVQPDEKHTQIPAQATKEIDPYAYTAFSLNEKIPDGLNKVAPNKIKEITNTNYYWMNNIIKQIVLLYNDKGLKDSIKVPHDTERQIQQQYMYFRYFNLLINLQSALDLKSQEGQFNTTVMNAIVEETIALTYFCKTKKLTEPTTLTTIVELSLPYYAHLVDGLDGSSLSAADPLQHLRSATDLKDFTAQLKKRFTKKPPSAFFTSQQPPASSHLNPLLWALFAINEYSRFIT